MIVKQTETDRWRERGLYVIKNDFMEMEKDRKGGWWLYVGTRRDREV